jgi:microcin C transport system substrate-binding protein
MIGLAATQAQSAETARHGVSLFGSLKYGPEFKHFDYVNIAAPKGGKVRLGAIGSYDSLNNFIVRGTSAAGLNLIYDTLMTPSYDEAGSEYGLVAQSVSYPPDFSSVTFNLRPAARFNDGKLITTDDVIWTFKTLKKINPFYSAYYRNVAKVEAIGPHQVKFTFAISGNRELPQIMGQLPILPKHFWTTPDAKGHARDITQTTLEIPLGSGPYKISKIDAGRSITYERVKDYWAKGLPVKIGSDNFDEIHFD